MGSALFVGRRFYLKMKSKSQELAELSKADAMAVIARQSK